MAAFGASSAPAVMMKLLVLAGDNSEISYQAIVKFLDDIGVPYQALVLDTMPADGSGNRLSGFALSDPVTGRGLYQGIIQTDSTFGVCDPTCHSLLSASDWAKLDTYSSQFKVRVLSYFTWPEAKWGLLPADFGNSYSDSNPLDVSFTSAAAAIFPYLTRSQPIRVGPPGGQLWAYRAVATAAANETTTPILTAGGYVVGATHTTADGRETFAFTIDNHSSLLHSIALSYGLINWVTKGVFIGSRQIYFTPHIDDMLIGDLLYAPNRPDCPGGANCPLVRTTGSDLETLSSWQATQALDPRFQGWRATFAYNGIGTTPGYVPPGGDTLVPRVTALGSQFGWVSHTWSHSSLDCYTESGGTCIPANSTQSLDEIDRNLATASTIGITPDAGSLVTPFNGGLANSAFLQAAAQRGIGYLITPYDPPGSNIGHINPYVPSILEVPRRWTNIFDNVDSPYAGVVGSLPDVYNHYYGPNGLYPMFDHDQSYSEIIDSESNTLLAHLLVGEAFPFGLHISNVATYDGTHSLGTDLMDAAIAKYKAMATLPVKTMSLSDIGRLLAGRARYNASGVTGVYTPGVNVVLTTVNSASIPVTGACSQSACPTFGGQMQDSVSMQALSTVTLSLVAGEGVGLSAVSLNPATVTGGSPSTGTVTLSGPAPAGGILVTLSSDHAAAAVPASVTVTDGNSTATFPVTTTAVATATSATITATYGAVSKTALLAVTPAVALSAVSLNPTTVTGGSPSTGTVTLSGPAPAGGILVTVSSDHAAAVVPASVTVTDGNSSATFAVSTTAVATATSATITATYGAVSKTALLAVTPAVALSAVSLNPTTVTGGSPSTGTVTLSGPPRRRHPGLPLQRSRRRSRPRQRDRH